jgi:hypothetical protein
MRHDTGALAALLIVSVLCAHVAWELSTASQMPQRLSGLLQEVQRLRWRIAPLLLFGSLPVTSQRRTLRRRSVRSFAAAVTGSDGGLARGCDHHGRGWPFRALAGVRVR